MAFALQDELRKSSLRAVSHRSLTSTGFISRIPRSPLGAFVDLLWISEASGQPHKWERILPTGSLDVVFTLVKDACVRNSLCGPRSEFLLLDTSVPFTAIGVRFKSGGGFPFFRVPVGELHNQTIPLDELWPESDAISDRLWQARSPAACLDILETALVRQAAGRFESHPAVRHALRVIHESQASCSIATLADGVGLSSRAFIKVFRDEIGMSPKLFCRIRRFNEVLRTLDTRPELNWTAIALACGYFDQAHFIHDFGAFSGVTPSAYLRHRTARNHIAVQAS